MVGDETYPATVGQLSVWRDIEKMPVERRWEANLPFVWEFGAGHTAEAIWEALGALAMRHEALRTTYLIDADGRLRQRIAVDSAAATIALVQRGTADASALATMEDEKVRDVIDVMTELSWRAWILTDDGVPARVLLVIHHIGADGMGVLLLQRDFEAILAGEPLGPVSSPREMALSQQNGEGARALKASERYWRRTLESAPHRAPAQAPAARLGATLHTGIPMPMAHDGAAKMEVSLHTLLLAGYYRGIRQALGTSEVLLFPITNNRFDPEAADVVTSLVQWAPLVVDFADTDPFEEMAQKLHWKTFNAMKHGVCDPDVIVEMRGEHERMDPPIDPGFYYNPILAPPGFPSSDTVVPSSMEFYEPARATGPGVYVIVRGLTSIDLVVRANRPGLDNEALATCLQSIQDALESAVGI